MKRLLLLAGVTAAAAWLGLCVLLYVAQDSLIYHPRSRALGATVSLMSLDTDGARVAVTRQDHDGPAALLYFGGNAEDVSRSLPRLAAAFPERALYLMHYRGFGGSTGRPSEAALCADAVALFDSVHERHSDVLVIGVSLGSGVAMHLASVRPVERLVLVAPFDSLQNVAAELFPWVPVRWLLRDRYDSWRRAPDVTAPTLVLAAEHDEIIPRARTEALMKHFREGVASLRVLRGTDHNSIARSPEYLPLLAGAR